MRSPAAAVAEPSYPETPALPRAGLCSGRYDGIVRHGSAARLFPLLALIAGRAALRLSSMRRNPTRGTSFLSIFFAGPPGRSRPHRGSALVPVLGGCELLRLVADE